jgi:hypothetical protein
MEIDTKMFMLSLYRCEVKMMKRRNMNLFYVLQYMRVNTSNRMTLLGLVVYIGKMTKECKILVPKSEGRRPIGRLKRKQFMLLK